jgi:hypothetical protein
MGGVGWGNSSSKAFGISFADRPKAKRTTFPGARVIKQLFLAREQKNSEKKLYFFFIEQIVIKPW